MMISLLIKVQVFSLQSPNDLLPSFRAKSRTDYIFSYCFVDEYLIVATTVSGFSKQSQEFNSKRRQIYWLFSLRISYLNPIFQFFTNISTSISRLRPSIPSCITKPKMIPTNGERSYCNSRDTFDATGSNCSTGSTSLIYSIYLSGRSTINSLDDFSSIKNLLQLFQFFDSGMWVSSSKRNDQQKTHSLGGPRSVIKSPGQRSYGSPEPNSIPQFYLRKVIGVPFQIKTPLNQMQFLCQQVQFLKKRCSQLQSKQKDRHSKRELESIMKSTREIENQIITAMSDQSIGIEAQKTEKQTFQGILMDLSKSLEVISEEQQEIQKLKQSVQRYEKQNGELKELRLNLRRQIEQILDI